MPDHDELLCTLDTTDVHDRSEQARRLTQRLTRRDRRAGVVTLCFTADAEADVRAFVRDESRCCSFFTFDITRTDEQVELRITAPAEQPMLDGLFSVFDDGDDAARVALFDAAVQQHTRCQPSR